MLWIAAYVAEKGIYTMMRDTDRQVSLGGANVAGQGGTPLSWVQGCREKRLLNGVHAKWTPPMGFHKLEETKQRKTAVFESKSTCQSHQSKKRKILPKLAEDNTVTSCPCLR